MVEGDWDILEETREHGTKFVVLNAADARSVGGHCETGTMARRTLLHYSVTDPDPVLYEQTLLEEDELEKRMESWSNGNNEILDNVCLRGKEVRPEVEEAKENEDFVSEDGLVAGYRWMNDPEVGLGHVVEQGFILGN